MKKRIITGVILVLVFIPLLLIPEFIPQTIFIFYGVCAFFSCVGAYEILRLSEVEKKYSWRVKAVVMISTLLIYFSGLSLWQSAQIHAINEAIQIEYIGGPILSIALILISTILQLSLLVFSKSFDAHDLGKSFLASFYVGLGVACITTLRSMGIRFILYLFLITTLTDVFAYVFGMLFGKHKMIERISPKKTWEGAIGGTIMASVTAALFAYLFGDLFAGMIKDVDPGENLFVIFSKVNEISPIGQLLIILLVTFIASIVSQIGDLVASKLKRTYGIKDFGNIFPGHGGFLDRFDSAILCSMFLLSAFLIVATIVGIPA